MFKNKGQGYSLVGKMLVLNLRFNSRTEDDSNEEERKEEKDTRSNYIVIFYMF